MIAKKMYHRGDRATAPGLFDLAMVSSGSRRRFQRPRISLCVAETGSSSSAGNPGQGSATIEAIAATGYRPSLECCVEVALVCLSELRVLSAPPGMLAAVGAFDPVCGALVAAPDSVRPFGFGR